MPIVTPIVTSIVTPIVILLCTININYKKYFTKLKIKKLYLKNFKVGSPTQGG
jgi:hypothetical protein